MKQKSIASICKPAVTLLASRSNNPAMPQRHNSGIYHPVTDNGGRHNPYFTKAPPVPGDNSQHSDPYRNDIINP